MSVPKNKRTVSDLEFFNTFNKIFDNIMYFTIKDFGIKHVVRNEYTLLKDLKMLDEDRADLERICKEYDISFRAEYPAYILEYHRTKILDILYDLLEDITTANSIYAFTEQECEMKRRYINSAIAKCNTLLQVFQRIINILPVNVEKYKRTTDLIVEEIKLLRSWKKSTNKDLRRAIYNTEKMRYEEHRKYTRDMIKAQGYALNSKNQIVLPAVSFDPSLIKKPEIVSNSNKIIKEEPLIDLQQPVYNESDFETPEIIIPKKKAVCPIVFHPVSFSE